MKIKLKKMKSIFMIANVKDWLGVIFIMSSLPSLHLQEDQDLSSPQWVQPNRFDTWESESHQFDRALRI